MTIDFWFWLAAIVEFKAKVQWAWAPNGALLTVRIGILTCVTGIIGFWQRNSTDCMNMEPQSHLVQHVWGCSGARCTHSTNLGHA